MAMLFQACSTAFRLRRIAACVAVWAVAGSAAACGTASADPEAATDHGRSAAVDAGPLFDSSRIHEISIAFDGDAYDEMIEVYAETGEKEWIEAAVTIDGSVYSDAGIRLKGNSSLMGLRGDLGGRGGGPAREVGSDQPELLPWLIRLDEYVAGQNHQGVRELVVRSNDTETALNEAVALELIDAAGLASQDAVAVRFCVNGSDEVLRLAVEHPDDVWMAEEFPQDGALYKAESTGDYRYRGDDPDAYDEVFDQEAGEANADLSPLIEFLDFLNNADDETFSAELSDRFDVDAFAAYLAVQELIANRDDIDGPGNNSYLYYDVDAERFTIVAWDHNLAFDMGLGGFGGGGRLPMGAAEDGLPVLPDVDGEIRELPETQPGDRPRPDDGSGPLPGVPGDGRHPGASIPEGVNEGGRFPGAMGGSNVLVDRFLGDAEFAALYEEELERLTADLFGSGLAGDVLAAWVELLETQASDLVDAAVVADEAALIARCFQSD